MAQPKILIVEDSPEMTLLTSSAINDKYAVTCVASSADALIAVSKHQFSLIIMDIELPDEDGFVLLSKIRMKAGYQDTPVFYLSGRSKVSDKVMGFTLGAEDYLVKPIDPLELRVRVDSRLKRMNQEVLKNRILQKGPFEADLERQQLTIHSDSSVHRIALTSIEFKLFVLLFNKEDRILSRDQILEEIWSNVEVTDRTVDSHIYTLRKKLGPWGSCIEAVPRAGYKFVFSPAQKVS